MGQGKQETKERLRPEYIKKLCEIYERMTNHAHDWRPAKPGCLSPLFKEGDECFRCTICKSVRIQSKRKVKLYPGKFAPWHEGHKFIVDKLREEGYRVVLGIKREISKEELSELRKLLDDIYGRGEVEVRELGWFDSIAHGRGTNYTFDYVETPRDIQEFSSTFVRKSLGLKKW